MPNTLPAPYRPEHPAAASPSSSLYLTPQQQDRILTWRSNASAADLNVPSPTSSKTKESTTKSAPASVNTSKLSDSKSKSQRSYYAKKRNGELGANSVLSRTNIASSTPTPARVPAESDEKATRQQLDQWETEPIVTRPEAEVAVPKMTPRIVGARDPISSNYWKQMFPPAPGMMAPGADLLSQGPYTRQMFGPGPIVSRPWGFEAPQNHLGSFQ